MPKYPANPTYVSGFHNSKNINGVDEKMNYLIIQYIAVAVSFSKTIYRIKINIS